MNLTIRCSSLARPMVCAGSLFFTDLPPQESSSAAEEGTAAGELLEKMLTATSVPQSGDRASNGVCFDNDMHFYISPIAQEILERAEGKVLCEQRIDWQTRSGIWIRGQYDVSYVGHDGTLYIDDLKYGWGIVDVRSNWQLLGYAVGEVMRRQIAFPKIVLRIHQPRPHHEDGTTRSWEISYNELLHYKEQIEARMDAIASGYRDLTTSEKCKYCPAGAVCPALNRNFYFSYDVALSFMQDNITDEWLSHQLDHAQHATEMIKIRQESLRALAVDRLKRGKIIPGYISEDSWGDRKWKKEISPDVVKLLTGKDITEKVMLSPAKAEKAGVPKEFVNALVDRHFLGRKLVKKDAGALADKIFGKPQGVN